LGLNVDLTFRVSSTFIVVNADTESGSSRVRAELPEPCETRKISGLIVDLINGTTDLPKSFVKLSYGDATNGLAISYLPFMPTNL